MTSFRIEMVPPLPRANQKITVSVDHLDLLAIKQKFPEDYDIIYHVGDRRFRYYPAAIITVIYDLYHEFTLVKDHEPHAMNLCGYTVLEMKFEDGMIMLSDPAYNAFPSSQNSIGHPIKPHLVLEEFQAVLEDLLYLIEERDS